MTWSARLGEHRAAQLGAEGHSRGGNRPTRRRPARDRTGRPLERLVRSELMRKAVLNEAKQKAWTKRPELQPLIDRARDQVIVSFLRPASVAKPGDGLSVPRKKSKQFLRSKQGRNCLRPRKYQLCADFSSQRTDCHRQGESRGSQKENRPTWARKNWTKPEADFCQALRRRNSAHKESAEKAASWAGSARKQMVPENPPRRPRP